MTGVDKTIPGNPGGSAREAAYYRRQVTDLGRRLSRSQESQARAQRDLWQAQLVVSMYRDFSRQTGIGGTADEFATALAERLVDSGACDGCLFLREVGRDDVFRAGYGTGSLASIAPGDFRLPRVPELAYGPDDTPEMRFLLSPIVKDETRRNLLWHFEPQSGFAILMSRSATSLLSEFDEGDKDVACAALACLASAFDTISYSVDPAIPGLDPLQSRMPLPHGKNGGIFGAEAKQIIMSGTPLKLVIGVERIISPEITDFVAYLLFGNRYQVVNTAKRQEALGWRSGSNFFRWIRETLEYQGPVRVYPQGSPELRLIVGILDIDRMPRAPPKQAAEDDRFGAAARTRYPIWGSQVE